MFELNIPLHVIVLGVLIFGAVQGVFIGFLLGIFKVTTLPRALVLVALVTLIESFITNVVLTGELSIEGISRHGIVPVIEATHGAIIGAILIIVPNMLIGIGTTLASKFLLRRFQKTI
jgi:uncharacterized membrane protein